MYASQWLPMWFALEEMYCAVHPTLVECPLCGKFGGYKNVCYRIQCPQRAYKIKKSKYLRDIKFLPECAE